MQILCVSDSHGDAAALLDLLERLDGTVDQLIFLGDGCRDLEQAASVYPFLPYAAVRGNCDPSDDFPAYRVLNLAGVPIFITHGHIYGVKGSLDLLRRTAQQERAGLVLFGHTHRPQLVRTREGLPFFNPGSLNSRQGTGSYGLLTVEAGSVRRLDHFHLDGTPLPVEETTFPW